MPSILLVKAGPHSALSLDTIMRSQSMDTVRASSSRLAKSFL